MSDETTQPQDVTETPAQPSDDETKEPALVPSFRLKEEAEKRREAETKLQEVESQRQQERLQIEMQYAKEMYGDSVEDAAVQEYKTKYPDLSYKQIFGALGIEVPTVHNSVSTPSRPAGAMSGLEGGEMKVSQLESLQTTNPAEYKKVMQEYAQGKIKVIPG